MDKPLVKIEYKTANGGRICVEASTSVKELLEQFDRQIGSQRRQDRRYFDFTPLTDEVLEISLLGVYEGTADLRERMKRNARLHMNPLEVLTLVLVGFCSFDIHRQ